MHALTEPHFAANPPLPTKKPMPHLRRSALSAVLAVGLLVIASITARAGETTVRASLNTELQSLDPIYLPVNATRVFAYMVFDTLVSIDSEGRYHPQMLESWEASSDRLTYTFRLRDGLVWTDGTPVTAEDCVASIQRWAKREPFGALLIESTRDFQILDPRTFALHLNRPFAFVIEALGKPGLIIPVMMPARLAKLPADKPVPEVVGSGPFIFRGDKWRPGERAILDRNPRYRPRTEPPDGLSGGKVVRVDHVELVSMPDQATRVAALQTGELDLLEVPPFDFIEALRTDPHVTVTSQQGIQQMMDILAINHRQPPFDNVLVRRALQEAVGQADIMSAYGLPGNMVQAPCLSIYMCNAPGTSDAGTEVFKSAGVERARSLLQEAGYHNEKVVILQAATSALLNSVALVVSDQMRRAGFNVDVRTSDFATVAARMQSQAPVEAGGWSVAPIVWNGIDMTNPLSNPAVSQNCTATGRGWYCDGQMTELLRQYSEAFDPARRKQLEAAIQAEFHKNVNVVLAGQFSAPMAYRSDLQGVVPFAFPLFWNMERK